MSSKRINTFSNKLPSPANKNNIKITESNDIDELLKEFTKNEKYEHLTVVGEGGMGQVTLSRDKNTLRKVAIKTLKKELLTNHEAIIRFTEEAQITAQLEHPNIIPVYEMGMDSSNAPFYTMKYVKGTNLKEILGLIKDNNEIILQKFHIIELLNIFVKICDAMSFACSKGVLHRDLKPENIMIGEFGEVLIVDWGLAKTFQLTVDSNMSFDQTQIVKKINNFIAENIDTIRSLNNVNLSIDNCLIGTPQYMAPERIIGQGDELSEVFALGTILHDILALKNMFTATEVKEVLQKIAIGEYQKLQNIKNLPHQNGGKIPQALIAVVEKATQKKPQERYSSINELKSEIESYILGFATKAERAGFFRLLKLGLARHKKISTLVLLLLITFIFISGVFIYELIHSRQNALNKSNFANMQKVAAKRTSEEVIEKSKELGKKISELKSHSDIIFDNAKHEIEQLKFNEALDYLQYVIDLSPEKVKYKSLYGQLLLSISAFDEATEVYKDILTNTEIDQNENLTDESQRYIQLSQNLSQKVNDKTINDKDYLILFHDFMEKKQYSMALNILNKTKKNEIFDQLLTRVWIKRLEKKNLIKESPNSNTQVSISALKGKFKVEINSSAIFDLSPLEKMPIRDLSLSNCKINNIDTLKGMPLEILSITNTQIKSLEAIQDAPITILKLTNNNISDLSPLSKMKLKILQLINCPVESLEPLTEMSINRLNIDGTLVSNLAPLRGMQLKHLNAMHTKIRNITPLRGMPIKTLLLSHSSVNNVNILKSIAPETLKINDTLVTALPEINTKNLIHLDIGDTAIKSILPLKGAKKLETIGISNTQITSVEVLRGMKLRSVLLTGTAVSDISPVINPDLKELQITGSYVSNINSIKSARNLETLRAQNCGISNISPLKELPLKYLDLSYNIGLDSINSLRNLELKELNLNNTSVDKIDALKNQPLLKLELNKTPIQDLSVISTLRKLKQLNLTGAKNVISLKPLMALTKLNSLRAYPYISDFSILENHPSLEFLGVGHDLKLKPQFWLFFKKKFNSTN